MSSDAGSLSSTDMDARPAFRPTKDTTEDFRRSMAPSPSPDLRRRQKRLRKKGGPKKLRESIGIYTSTTISRLARQGGVRRMEAEAHHATRAAIQDFMKEVSCQTSCSQCLWLICFQVMRLAIAHASRLRSEIGLALVH